MIEHVAVLVEPDQDIQPADIPVYDDAGERRGGPALAAAGQRRALPRGQGTSGGALREGILRPAGVPGRGEHVEGSPAGRSGPDHALPSHGQAPHPRDERGGDAE